MMINKGGVPVEYPLEWRTDSVTIILYVFIIFTVAVSAVLLLVPHRTAQTTVTMPGNTKNVKKY